VTYESVTWFTGQAVALAFTALAGHRLARAGPRVWKPAAIVSAVLVALWPLLRIEPTWSRAMLGTYFAVFLELTGVVFPAVLLFMIATTHMKRLRDRRALRWLPVMCALYFLRSGLWMVRPGMPATPTSQYADAICRQSTDYTCVAASLVTLLTAHGIPATENEMAKLSLTEVGNGTTDTRAVYALERKLAGQPVRVQYRRLDYDELQRVPLPCLVPLKWGYYSSHMVPVLSLTETHIVLGDPLSGRQEMLRADFEPEWLGRAIYVEGLSPASQPAPATSSDGTSQIAGGRMGCSWTGSTAAPPARRRVATPAQSPTGTCPRSTRARTGRKPLRCKRPDNDRSRDLRRHAALACAMRGGD